jgi:FkbM family methyltransferase
MTDASEKLLEAIDRKLETLILLARTARNGPGGEFHFLCRDKRVKMCLPFADVDVIQRSIALHHAFYEQKSLMKVASFVGPDAVVLDAGANIGNHTIFFALICGARLVMSFEVMRETFRMLERNVALNELENVRLYNLGLGARPSRAGLRWFGQGNIGAAQIEAGSAGPGAYEMTTVDELGLDTLDFMKIDVEGTHLDVLAGARETITRCRPRIWVELRPSHGEREPGEAFLAKMNYRAALELSRNDVLFEPR